MMEPLQPGMHLDADQLTAFAEGTLTTAERAYSLAHLSRCAPCREVLFLAQQAIPVEERPQSAAEPLWRRWRGSAPAWFGPLPLSVASLCCALLVFAGLHLRRHPVAATPPTEVAGNLPGPPILAETPEPLPQEPKEASARPRVAEHPVSPIAARPLPPIAAKADAAPLPASQLPTSIKASGINGALHGASAGTALNLSQSGPEKRFVAPQNQSAAVVDGVLVNNMTMVARSATRSAAAAAPVAMAAGTVHLDIAHHRISANGLSEITGMVKDISGAVVPGATVTLQPAAGTGTHSTSTDTAGTFTLAALPAGKYELSIAHPGFLLVARSIEVAPNDLAQLTTVLPVDASAETVEVSAASDDVMTTNAALSTSQAVEAVAPLPSKLPASTTVANGRRTLALDAVGTLFLSQDGGRHWKRIKQPWQGSVQQLTLTPQPVAVFTIVTADGSAWTSPDGKHWKRT